MGGKHAIKLALPLANVTDAIGQENAEGRASARCRYIQCMFSYYIVPLQSTIGDMHTSRTIGNGLKEWVILTAVTKCSCEVSRKTVKITRKSSSPPNFFVSAGGAITFQVLKKKFSATRK